MTRCDPFASRRLSGALSAFRARRLVVRTGARLQRPGEVAALGERTYWCPAHGQTFGAWHCASPEHQQSFGDATAAQIGEQELAR